MAQLYYQKLGQGHPLIILHGLYGSGDNWLSIARNLAGICEVYLPDQRNHGRSPHLTTHDYPSLTYDLKEFVDRMELRNVILLGHSMGGKTAMWFATEYPGIVSKLIVVDVSPASYSFNSSAPAHYSVHQEIISALQSVDLLQIKNMGEADRLLQPLLPEKRLRQFLLKNLVKNEYGVYHWRLNLKVLKQYIPQLAEGLPPETLAHGSFRQFPLLLIRGSNSDYVGKKDLQVFHSLFPLSQIVTIKNGSHWLHAEFPDRFTRIVRKFILG
ncbi:MAG: alpha/beta fold hydrolase [Bacteroidales bacterium]|nr:alpha/beta fold hydrolase [Bacteroidales bacterium]